ncbi:MAG: hydrogenase accessory protein [Bradyrhizobium sp.]
MPTVDVAQIDHFLTDVEAAGALAVLLFAGDPVRWPEAADVAVVLPELIEAFQGRLQGAVIAQPAELALAPRFNVQVYPSLVLCRDGKVMDVIPKIKDWSVYIDRVTALLDGAIKVGNSAKVVQSISGLDRSRGVS